MKFKKKTVMLASFTLGALLLATTALADIATKSGYDQLKDALKATAEQSSEKFDSFTMELSIAMKDNGKILMTENNLSKFDRSKTASEHNESRENIDGTKDAYHTYSDKTTDIRVSDSDPTYYVTEYTQEKKDEFLTNPFKEDRAEDIEKIADAVVGSLKDHVVVTENPDGSKGLSGSLTEVQIPSLVNAVASFELKQEFSGRQENLPHLTKDIFVKEVNGTAKVNKDGALENLLGTVVISGKDEREAVHEITLEVLFNMTDINSTTVKKPDLTGKKVVKNTAKAYGPEIANPEKFVGKFKNNILIEKDGKYVKAGEQIIEITHSDNKTLTGRYYEVYKPGFEQYASDKNEFSFSAQKSAQNPSGFDYTTESGQKETIYLEEHSGQVFMNGLKMSRGDLILDSSFSPDVE